MSSVLSKCFLRCRLASHPDIALPHSKEVVLGRGPNTKITDSRYHCTTARVYYLCVKEDCAVHAWFQSIGEEIQVFARPVAGVAGAAGPSSAWSPTVRVSSGRARPAVTPAVLQSAR